MNSNDETASSGRSDETNTSAVAQKGTTMDDAKGTILAVQITPKGKAGSSTLDIWTTYGPMKRHLLSVPSVAQTGQVLDGLIKSGIVEGLWLWMDSTREVYLLAQDPYVCKIVTGYDWEYLGLVICGKILDRPIARKDN